MSGAAAVAAPLLRLLVDYTDTYRVGATQTFRISAFTERHPVSRNPTHPYLKLTRLDDAGNIVAAAATSAAAAAAAADTRRDATPKQRHSSSMQKVLSMCAFDFLEVRVHAMLGAPHIHSFSLDDTAFYRFFTVVRTFVYIDIDHALRQLRAKGYLNDEYKFVCNLVQARNVDALHYSHLTDPTAQLLRHNWNLETLAAFMPASASAPTLASTSLALLPYQCRGVAWMRHIETLLPIAMTFNGCTAVIDGHLWLTSSSRNKTILTRRPVADAAMVHAQFWGGLLALPLGSGKTSIAVTLVRETAASATAAASTAASAIGVTSTSFAHNTVLLYETSATLIVVPDQLLSHWVSELARWGGRSLRVHVCSKIAHHTGLTYRALSQYDIVLVTRAFLVSASYLSFVTGEIRAMCPWLPGFGMSSMSDENMHMTRCALFHAATVGGNGNGGNDGGEGGGGDDATHHWVSASVHKRRPVFSFVLWRRLIVDEVHEWMMSDRDRRRRHIGVRHGSLASLYARARWGMTATPTMDESSTMRQYADFLTVSPLDANHYVVDNYNDPSSAIALTPNAVHSVHGTLVLDTQNSTLHWPNINGADGSLENLGTMHVRYSVTTVALLPEETAIVAAIMNRYCSRIESTRAAEMCSVTFQSFSDSVWQRVTCERPLDVLQQTAPWYTVEEMRVLIAERFGASSSSSSMLTFANNSLNAAAAAAAASVRRDIDCDDSDADGDGDGGDNVNNDDDNDGDVCPVCREPDSALDVSLPCCHWFCYTCCETTCRIAASLQRPATCPVCRAPFQLSQCMRMRSTAAAVSAVPQPLVDIETIRRVYGSKACALLHMVLTAHENAAFLVVSQYNSVSRALVRIMREQRVSCAMVIGTSDQRNLAVERYKQRKVRVLFVTTDAGCSGLHLPETTHVVFTHPLHSMTTTGIETKYRQLVGRMLRPGNPRDSVFITSLVTSTESAPPITDFLDTNYFARSSQSENVFDFGNAAANFTYSLAVPNVVGLGKLSARSLLNSGAAAAAPHGNGNVVGGGGGGEE